MKGSSLQKGVLFRCGSWLLVAVLALALLQTSSAFQVTKGHTYSITPSTALQAWTLPHENSFTFRTWYNEYNPTARVTVYNEYVYRWRLRFCTPTIKPRLTHFSSLFSFEFSSPDPIERYSFVTVGSDWPSTLESSSFSPQPSSPIHKRYANPIKRAWRRRTLRRLIAAAQRTYGIVEE